MLAALPKVQVLHIEKKTKQTGPKRTLLGGGKA
jgi:hypothetical protein